MVDKTDLEKKREAEKERRLEAEKERRLQTERKNELRKEISDLVRQRDLLRREIMTLHNTERRFEATLERTRRDTQKESTELTSLATKIKKIEDEINQIKRQANEDIKQKEAERRVMGAQIKNFESVQRKKEQGGNLEQMQLQKTTAEIQTKEQELAEIERKIRRIELMGRR